MILPREWRFDDDRIVISAVMTDRGKIALRAEGRMLTAPISESEPERHFTAFGRSFVLRRVDGGELTLEEQETVEATAPPVTAATTSTPPAILVTGLTFIVSGVIVACLMAAFAAALGARRLNSPVILNGESNEFLEQGIANFNHILALMGRGAAFEVLVAALMAGAGVAVLTRKRWAPRLLVWSSWGLLVPLLLTMAAVDRLTHTAVFQMTTPADALRKLHVLHRGEVFLLIVACIGVGLLLSAARRERIEAAIAQGTV